MTTAGKIVVVAITVVVGAWLWLKVSEAPAMSDPPVRAAPCMVNVQQRFGLTGMAFELRRSNQ